MSDKEKGSYPSEGSHSGDYPDKLPPGVIKPRKVEPRDSTKNAAIDASLSSALLLEAAEIENRLRDHIMELLDPAFKRSRAHEAEIREVKNQVATHSEQVKDLIKYQQGALSSVDQIERFRVELATWDNERRAHEQTISDRVSFQEIEINSLRRSLEKKTSDEGGVSRTLKTLGDEMARFQNEIAELRRFTSDRLDMNRDKIAKLRDEFETRSLAIENKLHRCMDNQTGLETDTSHTRAELNRMSKTVMEAITVMDELDLTKASVSCIEKQQQEFSEFAHQVSDHVGVLRQQFGTLVDDVKAHFETASKVVATSTAKQVADMRESYRSEVARMDTVLSEIEAFMASQHGNETALKEDVDAVKQMAKFDNAALRESFEDADSKRAKHANRLDLEIQQLRRTVKEMESSFMGNTNTEVSGAMNLRNDLLAMLVESQQLAAALAYQDNLDRKRIALFGFKGNRKDEKLPAIEGNKSMHTPRRPTLGAAARSEDDQEIMTLDQRCLSCNPNRGMALAGFKIACLQYSPTPVEYQRSTYSREELIRLQMDLLNQAQETLRSNASQQ